MSEFTMLKGSSANLYKVPIREGQLIFTTDEGNRQIFLDISDTQRIEITNAKAEENDIFVLNGGGAPIFEEEDI